MRCVIGHPSRSDLIELARRRMRPSIEICMECEAFLEEQLVLTETMSELAAEAMALPPPQIESFWGALPQPPARRLSLKIAAVVAMLAAGLAWVWAVPRVGNIRPAASEPLAPERPPQPPATPPAIARVARTNRPPVKAVAKRSTESPRQEDAFVQIPYTLPLDPQERVTVMRMEMPVTALAAAGLSIVSPDPRASAQTDVLVGEDGRIRAVRLISISSSDISTADRRTNP